MNLYIVLLWPLSGILLGLSFLDSALVWFAIPGLLIFLYLIQTTKSYSALFWFGTLAGTVRFTIVLSWFLDTFPIKWIPEFSAGSQLTILWVYIVSCALSMGVGMGIFSVLAKKIFTLKMRWVVLLLPLTWLLGELSSSFVFSLFSIGESSTPNAYFSFGYLGYVLAESNVLIFYAKVHGVYGLSIIFALLSVTLYIFLERKMYTHISRLGLLFCGLCIFFALPLFFQNSYIVQDQKVIAVETYFGKEFDLLPDKRKVKEETLLLSVAEALKADPDTIILSEDVRFSRLFNSLDQFFLWVYEQNPTFDGIIIDSLTITDERSKSVVRAFIYDAKTSSVYSFDKQYLVPQGEFMPSLAKKLIGNLMEKEALDKIVDNMSYYPGLEKDGMHIPTYVPGILFCFESVSPLGVKKATAARTPAFVAHIVSHAWFVNPDSFWYQLDTMLKVQAVWNNVPIVSAGNMSESKLYLPTGEIQSGTAVLSGKYFTLKYFEF